MSDLTSRAGAVAGRTPGWISESTWHAMIADGAVAIADVQIEPNNGTPEEYAAAAIRAAIKHVRARSWKAIADQLGERLEHHAHCDDGDRLGHRAEECPFCADIAAVEAWRAATKRA